MQVSPIRWALRSKRNFLIFDTVAFTAAMFVTFSDELARLFPLSIDRVKLFIPFVLVILGGGVLFALMHWMIWGKKHQLP